MVTTCKLAINGKDGADMIWTKEHTVVLERIEVCLQLNEQYRPVKEKLMSLPKGRQFDFSKTQIFGKFEIFGGVCFAAVWICSAPCNSSRAWHSRSSKALSRF